MELENLREQKPESNDPFGGNRWFRIAVIALGALSVIGVLLFLLIFLGFCSPNRATPVNPTAQPPPTAVVIVETQAPPTVVAEPTTVSATATRVLEATVVAVETKVAEQPTAVLPTTAAPITPTLGITATIAALPTRASTRPRPTIGPVLNVGPLAGMYVTGLRYEPSYPVRNNPVNFFATINNRTGKDQHYPLCAEIFVPDKPKPIGTTDCNLLTIPPGVSDIPIGFWIASGIKQCTQFRARVVMREQGGEERIPFVTEQGGEHWTDFGVCP